MPNTGTSVRPEQVQCLQIYAPDGPPGADGEQMLVVEWRAPANADGSALTYVVQWSSISGAASNWSRFVSVNESAREGIAAANDSRTNCSHLYTHTIANLTACSCYNVSVSAIGGDKRTVESCTAPSSILTCLVSFLEMVRSLVINLFWFSNAFSSIRQRSLFIQFFCGILRHPMGYQQSNQMSIWL